MQRRRRYACRSFWFGIAHAANIERDTTGARPAILNCRGACATIRANDRRADADEYLRLHGLYWLHRLDANNDADEPNWLADGLHTPIFLHQRHLLLSDELMHNARDTAVPLWLQRQHLCAFSRVFDNIR